MKHMKEGDGHKVKRVISKEGSVNGEGVISERGDKKKGSPVDGYH